MFTVYWYSLLSTLQSVDSLVWCYGCLFVILVLGAVKHGEVLSGSFQCRWWSQPLPGFYALKEGRAGGVGGMSWAAILNSIVSFLGEPVGPAWTLSNVLSSLVAMGCLMSIKWCFVHWFMKVSKRQFLAREGLATLGLVITVRDWYLDTRYGTPWFVGKFNQFRSVQKNLQKIIIVIYILHLTEDDY